MPGMQHSTELQLIPLHVSPAPSHNKMILFHSNAVSLLSFIVSGREIVNTMKYNFFFLVKFGEISGCF